MGSKPVPSSSSRPRVAIVSHAFPPSLGGAERYHLFTARRTRAWADVRVLTAISNLGPARTRVPPPQLSDGMGGTLPVEYLPSRRVKGENMISPVALRRALKTFDPDALWTNSPSPSSDVAATWALRAGIPWIATYHAGVTSSGLASRAYMSATLSLLRKATLVLVNSEAREDELLARGVPRDRIVVAPPGPYLGDGVMPSARATEGTAEPRCGPYHPFLFVGALDKAHAYKRLDTLIEAVGRLDRAGLQVHLRVIGDGPERIRWESLAVDKGIANRVTFSGRVSDADLAQAYADAWTLVLPATTGIEGFGSVALEALPYGCPIISSTAVAAGELLSRHGAALTFPASDPFGLENVLRRLAEEPGLRLRLARSARGIASSFGWEKLGPPLDEAVRRVVLVHNRNGAAT